MKRVCFIIARDKFTDGLISWLEMYFIGKYEFIFYTNKIDGKYPLSAHKSMIIELDSSREAFKNPYIDDLLSADAVIISGFYFNPPKNIKEEKSLFEKLWIHFWGGDYSCFRPNYISEGLRVYLERYKRKMRFIRNCRGWISLMEGENSEITRWSLTRKPTLVAPVMWPEVSEERELSITKDYNENGPLKIILGNSASPENRHIEIIKRLAHLKDENIQIICPLSYGDSKIIQKVSKIGKETFGDKFIPLVDFLPKSEYLEMLHDIDIAIYNCNRQQAIGNIEEMLRQGKKVYISKKTPMWKWFLGRGENIYSTESLKSITLEDLSYFPRELAQANIEVDKDLRKTMWAVKRWENVLEVVTANKL